MSPQRLVPLLLADLLYLLPDLPLGVARLGSGLNVLADGDFRREAEVVARNLCDAVLLEVLWG